jgi:DNA modification methylase
MPSNSVHCVVTSPPYWGLRDYGCEGQLGMERTLGEHLAVMVDVFDLVRRAMKPEGTLWLNYGDCYATKPNGRSAADTKASGNDDRTFRDKPFSTVGPIYEIQGDGYQAGRRGRSGNLGNGGVNGVSVLGGRVVAGGALKPKDLCMIPNRLAIALQEAGWWVRSEIVWGKPNPMPDSSGRYRPSTAHEKLFLLSKSANCFYDAAAVALPCSPNTHARLAQNVAGQIGSDRANAGGKTNGRMKAVGNAQLAPKSQKPGIESQARGAQPESRYLRNYEPDLSAIIPPQVWEIATAAFSEAHFATFPPALVVPCILAGCPEGGTVLDPFFGAGTTGLVADRLQRNCIGIELNASYAEMAMRRIQGDAGMLSHVEIDRGATAETRAA